MGNALMGIGRRLVFLPLLILMFAVFVVTVDVVGILSPFVWVFYRNSFGAMYAVVDFGFSSMESLIKWGNR